MQFGVPYVCFVNVGVTVFFSAKLLPAKASAGKLSNSTELVIKPLERKEKTPQLPCSAAATKSSTSGSSCDIRELEQKLSPVKCRLAPLCQEISSRHGEDLIGYLFHDDFEGSNSAVVTVRSKGKEITVR